MYLTATGWWALGDAMATLVQKATRQLTLAGVRTGFRLGEFIAPERASHYAEKLWFSVPAAPSPEKRHRGVEPADTFLVRVDDIDVPVHTWGQGPTVLLLHGWSGWWQQYSVYVEPLVAAGFRVLAWDSPSHGDAPPGRYGPRRSSMPEMAATLQAVVAKVGRPAGLVAHSGGAMAAMLEVIDGLPVDKVVWIAPSVSAAQIVDLFRGRLGWGRRTTDGLLSRLARVHDVEWEDYEVLHRLAHTRRELPPALILHDVTDTETPADGSRRLAAAWPQAQHFETDGLGHYKVLWAPASVSAVVEFLSGS